MEETTALKPQWLERLAKCLECGKQFNQRYLSFMGQDICSRFCEDCSANKIEQEHQEEADKLLLDKVKAKNRWRQHSGIPSLFMNECFATFKQDRPGNVKKAYDKCKAYADNFPDNIDYFCSEERETYPSLFLYSDGVWGNGKTHLACSIAHKVIESWAETGENLDWENGPVIFISESELLAQIQSTYNSEYKDVTEQTITKTMVGIPLLIIDDVGKERRNKLDYVYRIFMAIVNGRYDALRPLVMTANGSIDEIKYHLSGGVGDGAIFSRLLGMCQGKKLFMMTGEDYRRVKEPSTAK